MSPVSLFFASCALFCSNCARSIHLTASIVFWIKLLGYPLSRNLFAIFDKSSAHCSGTLSILTTRISVGELLLATCYNGRAKPLH
ncbi:hypothetical protein XELAEV_18004114mg [Xenopus laevis]|uniref:Uncharacterized protein n=1 Tax=Xenopus laevis TaxID=8355 RepID=A0A974GYE5_XENLA|nr:hypothetical protein XELAEV_18004114mg [Xenopus laevis]